MDTVPALEDLQAQVMKTMAHPFRIKILEVISVEEECVCHLSALFRKPQPLVSQHLATLKEAGLVVDRRVAQRVFYRSADPRVADMLSISRTLAGGTEQVPGSRGPVPGCPCPKCDPAAR